MANYIVPRSDPLNGTVTVTQGQIGITSPLLDVPLVGQNAVNYGLPIARTQVHLTENFANSTAPANPLTGQLWYDNANNILMVNTGGDGIAAVWDPVGAGGAGWDGVSGLTPTLGGDLRTGGKLLILEDAVTPLSNPPTIAVGNVVGPALWIGPIGTSAYSRDIILTTLINPGNPVLNRSVTLLTDGNVRVTAGTTPTNVNDLATKAYVDNKPWNGTSGAAPVLGGNLRTAGKWIVLEDNLNPLADPVVLAVGTVLSPAFWIGPPDAITDYERDIALITKIDSGNPTNNRAFLLRSDGNIQLNTGVAPYLPEDVTTKAYVDLAILLSGNTGTELTAAIITAGQTVTLAESIEDFSEILILTDSTGNAARTHHWVARTLTPLGSNVSLTHNTVATSTSGGLVFRFPTNTSINVVSAFGGVRIVWVFGIKRGF